LAHAFREIASDFECQVTLLSFQAHDYILYPAAG